MFRKLATVFFIALSGRMAIGNDTSVDQTVERDSEQLSQAVENGQSAIDAVPVAVFENRFPGQTRKKCVAKFGGTAASEAAVAASLHWIAKHQLPDGSWDFDHRNGPDHDSRGSANPGSLSNARIAATAMAMLPFLGAGQTHKVGNYQEEVKDGLSFLASRMQPNGSLWESGGTMYSHGLATIALCEAFGMTRDKKLKQSAKASLEFIEFAQDPVGGGWRYSPRQPGDTSVSGWQLTALASGQAANLKVPSETLEKASSFLDSVQAGDGAFYGYTTPAKRSTTSAVGLVCRIHLGWEYDEQALQHGMQYLAGVGFSRHDMYYNYSATQVMFQCGGEHWEQWNKRMRDFLIDTQARDGLEKGSWHFKGGHGAERGGRLYNTSLAAMMLEVYYRHARDLAKDVPHSGKPVGIPFRSGFGGMGGIGGRG